MHVDPATGQQREQRGPPSLLAWCGYAAFVAGLLYAAVNAYWAAGGTVGLDTLGGELEALGRARDPQLIAVVWLTAVLKLVAALLELAVAQPWGQRLPRWMLLAAAWGATAVLVLYGSVLVVGQALVQIGIIEPSAAMDWKAFHWHLFLWDPWFLVWGLLLGAAAWGVTRRRGTARSDRVFDAGLRRSRRGTWCAGE